MVSKHQGKDSLHWDHQCRERVCDSKCGFLGPNLRDYSVESVCVPCILKTSLFVFDCAGSLWVCWLLSSCGKQRLFSSCGGQLLIAVASCCSAWALEREGFSNCGSWALRVQVQ